MLAIRSMAVLFALTVCARADEPRGTRDPLRYRDAAVDAVRGVKKIEFVEMLTAVLTGSQMGPSDGWFHPSKSRYDSKWLLSRFDRNGDGTVGIDEFDGPRELFDRLDRDGNGVVRKDDLDWSPNSLYATQMQMVSRWMNQVESSHNGRLTKDQWLEFFNRTAGDKGYLTAEDLYKGLMQPPRREPPPKGSAPRGPTPAVLLPGLFTGELGSFFQGPEVGDRAPNFTLETHDGKRTVSLSDYRGKKPVVLVFGSFT